MKQSLKKRVCICGEKFTPINGFHRACSPKCALELNWIKAEKKRKRENNKSKRKLRENDRGFQLKKAQAAFNRYIRVRDKGLPCISCGRHHGGQYHAGHYRTVGACPELRFEELNCHKQCAPCNNHKSGDIVNYRAELINRIGIDAVDWLEGCHQPKKYTLDDIKAITAKYTQMAKDLESVC